ncbi:MAG: S9 family peptidase, partial [Gemmatimonadota bacterium]|nr:S9 family peptidase [Gemmatimonadota bacterium]
MSRTLSSWLTGAVAALVVATGVAAQNIPPAGGYLQPPAPIPQILDAAPTPLVSLSPSSRVMALYTRSDMPTIAELAEPELRLAGVRINPRTNGPSRSSAYTGIAFENVDGGGRRDVRLPADARVYYP